MRLLGLFSICCMALWSISIYAGEMPWLYDELKTTLSDLAMIALFMVIV